MTILEIENWQQTSATQIVEHLKTQQMEGNQQNILLGDIANQFGETNVDGILKIVVAIVSEVAKTDAATKLDIYKRSQIAKYQDRLQAYREAMTVYNGIGPEPEF